MGDNVLPFGAIDDGERFNNRNGNGNHHNNHNGNGGLDLSALRSVPTIDKKRSHMSDARVMQVLDGFFAECGLTTNQEKLTWLATLVRYLWENGTSPNAKYKDEQWGNVYRPLDELLPLVIGEETMRRFGRSAYINKVAYELSLNPANRKWIEGYAKAKGVSADNAAYAFDFYDRTTYPIAHPDSNGEIHRSMSRALRDSFSTAPERAEGSGAVHTHMEEHMY